MELDELDLELELKLELDTDDELKLELDTDDELTLDELELDEELLDKDDELTLVESALVPSAQYSQGPS